MGLADRFRASVPRNIAKDLGSAGLTRILRLMVGAHRDLEARGCTTATTNEDSITEEWYVHILLRWKESPLMSCIPVHQKGDATKAKSRGKPPTVDFCFRDGFDSRSYFGVECKLLDESEKKYLKAYLHDTEGIGRFLSGRYSAYSGVGAMAGYVRSGSCDKVAASLRRDIQKLDGKPTLRKSRILSNFDQLYESRHTRDCPVAAFLCYHLLLGFNCDDA